MGINMKKKIICICLCMLVIIPVLSATVTANQPPTAPVITGETNGKKGVSYEYTFLSTDPDGDDVYYHINWGEGYCSDDQYTDFYPSGENATVSHTFSKGTHTIKAKAIDIHQAKSSWATLEVTMPKAFNFNFNLLEWLMDRFPMAFLVFGLLIGLK